MKSILRRTLCMLVCAVMVIASAGFSVFAEAADAYSNNFNDSANQVTVDSSGTTVFKPSNGATFPITFEGGLGGKPAGDYSLVETINDSSDVGGLQILKYADYETAKSINWPRYVYSMNVMYSGDADYMLMSMKTIPYKGNKDSATVPLSLRVENGAVTLNGTNTGLICRKDEWLRVVIDLNTNKNKGYIYINGNKFEFGYNYVDVVWWFQVAGGFSAAGDGTKTAKIIVDDVDISKESNTTQYAVTDAEKVSFTVDTESGIGYDSENEKLIVPEGTEVSAVLSVIDTACSKVFVDAVGSFAEKTGGTAETGNAVVLKSADGKTFEYLTVEIGEYVQPEEPDPGIDYGTIAYEKDFNTAAQQENTGLKLSNSATYPISFNTGVSGRSADDSSYIVTADDKNGDCGIEIPFYAWQKFSEIGADVVTLEASILVDGELNGGKLSTYMSHHASNWNQWTEEVKWVEIKNGRIYVYGSDTGLVYRHGEWLRVAVEEHAAGTVHYVYINGNKFTVVDPTANVLGNRWTQFYGTFLNKGTGSNYGILGIDDIKIYNRAYTPTGKETVGYTVNDTTAFDYVAGVKSAIINGNTTVADLLNAVQTENTKECRTSLSNPAVITEGKAADGNVIVIKSEDGKSYDYLHATTSQDCRIVYSDKMTQSSYFTSFGTGTETTVANESGLYTKASDDVSFTLKSELAAGTSVNFRSNYMAAIDGAMFNEDSFTYEFSIAFEGDMNEVSLANFVSDEKNERFAYNNPVKFLNGKIYVNDNGNAKFVRNYREKEWYRIGITYYPKELKQDIYVNGKKYINKGWVVDDVREEMRDPSQHKLTGFYWNQISVKYTENADKARSGKVSVDDTLLYYGGHFDAADYQTTFSSLDYATGGSIANDIYLDEAGIEIGDFAGRIIFDENNPPVFYTGNDYTTQAEVVDYGTTIVCTSPNGLVKEYYVVLSPEVSIDNKIKCFVNGYEQSTFAEKASGDDSYSTTLSATASAVAPAYETSYKGCLILAIYKNGVLVKTVTDSKDIKSYTGFSVSYTINETEGISAKAMFMESLNSLKPYAASETFTVQTAE